jgi:hypothetical protein
MSSEADKFRRLVDMLWERTSNRELPWVYDSKTKVVSIAIGNRVLTLSQGQNQNYEELYTVTIYNEQGQLVDRFNDENINGESPPLSDFVNYFSLMESLYAYAQRRAVGADVALDEMLKDLENGNFSSDLDEPPF